MASQAKPKSQAQKVRDAYQRGLADGQHTAFTMLALIHHPDLLSELLEGRSRALAAAFKALGGRGSDSGASNEAAKSEPVE
jgi:hypothetical protein